MIGISLVVLSLFWEDLCQKVMTLRNRLTGYEAKAAHSASRLKMSRCVLEEIENLKKYMETDEYAEEVAREKLGLVKDNETVFKKQK